MIKEKRVLIIGSAGSGKTTFSKKLSSILEIPIVHLDKEYWQPSWQKPPHEEWVKKVECLIEQETWILDGNYGSTLDQRLQRAELVIFLDYKRSVCLKSVIRRTFQNCGRQRDDLGKGCIEKVDFKFLKWVWDFPKKYRPRILELLNQHTNVQVIQFKNRKEAACFLNTLEEEKNMCQNKK